MIALIPYPTQKATKSTNWYLNSKYNWCSGAQKQILGVTNCALCLEQGETPGSGDSQPVKTAVSVGVIVRGRDGGMLGFDDMV